MDKISVVVVDDHPIFLAGLQQLFKKQADFELLGVAESAEQLEAVLAQTTPDVILMDIEMPERDGISATVLVRKQRPGAKVVMLTGYDNPDLIFRALKAGAVGYLLKNTRSKEILDTLRRVAAGELFLNPELAGKFQVHGNQVSAWKKTLVERAAELFEDGRKKSDDGPSVDELYEQIGRLRVELEWLKKKGESAG